MVESRIFEDDEHEPLLIGYSQGEPRLLDFDDAVKAVENSARRENFNSLKLSTDEEVTPDAKPSQTGEIDPLDAPQRFNH